MMKILVGLAALTAIVVVGFVAMFIYESRESEILGLQLDEHHELEVTVTLPADGPSYLTSIRLLEDGKVKDSPHAEDVGIAGSMSSRDRIDNLAKVEELKEGIYRVRVNLEYDTWDVLIDTLADKIMEYNRGSNKAPDLTRASSAATRTSA